MRFGDGLDSRPAESVTVPEREIYRYLGCGKQPADEVKQLIGEVCETMLAAVRPQAYFRRFPLENLGQGRLRAASFEITSRHLSKNMRGCEEVILLAATLGHGLDARLRLFGRMSVTRQVILQAASAAYLEAYLDLLQQELRLQAAEEGRYLRPRFSPGYGDFPLEYQREIAAELQLEKRLGIVLSDSLMMIPSKSVTALIGVAKEALSCPAAGCETCPRTDCTYRRN